MRVIKLESDNFKRLRAVSIEPDPEGNLVIIGGRNAQGKSSVLDSIACAIGGGKLVPSKPVHEGEQKGEITVDLGEYKITRTFKADGGGTLKVTEKGGAPVRSPQTLLDSLVSSVSFDPLSFMLARPEQQSDTLRRLVGIDFAAMDKERAAAYENRTVVNRDAKRVEGALASKRLHRDAPDGIVSVSALSTQLDAEMAKTREHEGAQEQLAHAAQAVEDAKEAFARAQESLKQARSSHADAEARAKAIEPGNPDPIREQIANAEELNAKVRENEEHARLKAELAEYTTQSDSFTKAIKDVDSKKQAALRAAKFPVEGLSFDDAGLVTYQGMPLDQASGAERMRVSVAIGAALNPKIKVLLVRDGSLLDDENLVALAKIAEEYDAQVWIERVGDKDASAIIIEDGSCASQKKGG
jgi:DNA repair exonuclease SbcCD ATPase subunit